MAIAMGDKCQIFVSSRDQIGEMLFIGTTEKPPVIEWTIHLPDTETNESKMKAWGDFFRKQQPNRKERRKSRR